MDNRKAKKVSVSNRTVEKLKELEKTLIARGLKKHNIGAMVDYLVESKESNKILERYIDENTPLSFKFELLLKDPASSKKIEEMVKKKKFGLNSSEQVIASQ